MVSNQPGPRLATSASGWVVEDDWGEEPKEPGTEHDIEQLNEPQPGEYAVTQKVHELSADETTPLEVARQLLNVRNTGQCPIVVEMEHGPRVVVKELAPGESLERLCMTDRCEVRDVTFKARGVPCSAGTHVLEYDK